MPKLESPGLQAEEHIIKHDRRSEILVEIEALILDRLFGPGPWFLAHREAVVQLRERILKWGLEEPVPGKKGHLASHRTGERVERRPALRFSWTMG